MSTTPREEAIRVLDAYFNALITHDASEVPLTQDVVFKRPTGEVYHGIEKVKHFLSNLSWTALRVEGHIIDGDQCASLFDYDRPDASIRGFDYFLLENGKIKEIRPYLNPVETDNSAHP
ncbi:nuclear transport factor 2 family protein [Thermodesulfobacteriota bacterium]